MVLSSPPSSDSDNTSSHRSANVLSPAIIRLKGLLRQICRITTSDGRIFIGTFAGTDQPLNVLLINTEEYRPGSDEIPEGRYVGQVVIPWKLVVKVEIEGQAAGGANGMQQSQAFNEMYF